MKVDKINAYKDLFKEHLVITQDYNELYKYECLQHFSDNWSLDELDLATMFDKSLTSNISARLWGGSTNSAKSVMLQFIALNKEFVRSMFRDLYNEDKDLGLRINRFIFHCDELLSQLQQKETKLNYHHHSDQELSVYLAFKFPAKYNLFNYGPFSIMMNRLEAKNVPQEFEVERFFKLCKGLYSILSRDTELLEIHRNLRKDPIYYGDDTMLLVHDFLIVCSQKPVLT